ncbi:MAG: hypothetical protein KAI29_23520, partial [Cyclobacteriaceae bacterium]|nr:hypothetical protein [Cyclobacteriaceae bacterium]
KYYLKAITTLESTESRLLLPKIYKEYGDFYAKLNLPELTIENYVKALNIVVEGQDYSLQKEIIEKIAFLSYDLGDIETSINHYNTLYVLHKNLNEETDKIKVLKTLSSLYKENKDYENAIFASKELLNYYQRIGDESNQIAYLSEIGEISYASGNLDQADKAFKSYFRLAKKDENLQKEIASLRYIQNLITEGDIYTWSMDNGYWSDYETAIRYYNDAQKQTDFQLYPGIASTILNRIGVVYFKREDFKTCVTYFDLALYYSRKPDNLDFTSENHIMLARAYDALDKWKYASKHYELHAAYKHSIIQKTEIERKALADLSTDNEKQSLFVEQTLDRIEAQERQEVIVAEKELRNITLESELELYRQDVELKEMLIQNQKMAEESAVRNYLLTKEQLENERNTQKIEHLNSERIKQDLELENKEIEQKNERQRMKILEQENSLARSQQAYYLLSIILISFILIFILVVYIQ